MAAARRYPARLLSRAVNALSPEILNFMNAEERIILLCDWDERIAVPAANLLFEKGADNVVLLSGGGADVTVSSCGTKAVRSTRSLLMTKSMLTAVLNIAEEVVAAHTCPPRCYTLGLQVTCVRVLKLLKCVARPEGGACQMP